MINVKLISRNGNILLPHSDSIMKTKLSLSQPISHSFDKEIPMCNYKKCKDINNNYMNSLTKIEFPDYSKNTIYSATLAPNNMENPIIIDKSCSKSNKWTKEEDKLLLNIVKMVGPKKWKKIASILKTKTEKQCRDHYVNCLDPKIKNSIWTENEERILLLKYKEYGTHWSRIKKFLPGRTTLMIKNYLPMILKKKKHSTLNDIMNQEPIFINDSKLNEYSENEQSEEVFFDEGEKFPIQNNEFSIFDINYLLNKPEITNNV